MQKKTRRIVIATAVVGGVVALGYHQWALCIAQLAGRFPGTSNEVLKKAFREMVSTSFHGGYKDIDLTDEACDAIFRNLIQKHTL